MRLGPPQQPPPASIGKRAGQLVTTRRTAGLARTDQQRHAEAHRLEIAVLPDPAHRRATPIKVANRPWPYAPFEAADYLDSEEVIAGYLSAATEDAKPDVFPLAFGDAAKARGMAQIAKSSGLSRENLYKALSVGVRPRHETISAILRALGVKIAIVANGKSV